MSSGAFERAVLLGLGGSGSHMWTSLTPFTTSLPPSSPQSLTSQLAGEISEIGYWRSLLESSLTYRKTWENHTLFVWSDTIHHIATVVASKPNITTCWMDNQNGSVWSLLESSLTVVFCIFCLFVWSDAIHHIATVVASNLWSQLAGEILQMAPGDLEGSITWLAVFLS